MREHTPGRWIPTSIDNDIWVRTANGIPIAKIADSRDACLIAAAPDLLAAILHSDDAYWTSAMRAAIAKAAGTQAS